MAGQEASVAMTREQKIDKARFLRAMGLTHREIGERFGVSASTAYKWVHPEKAKEWNRRTEANPERKAYKREWERRECPDCGGVMSGPKSARCGSCRQERKEREIRERAEAIIALRAEGLTNCQIDEFLDLPGNTAAKVLCYDAPRFGLEVPPPPYWSRGKVPA